MEVWAGLRRNVRSVENVLTEMAAINLAGMERTRRGREGYLIVFVDTLLLEKQSVRPRMNETYTDDVDKIERVSQNSWQGEAIPRGSHAVYLPGPFPF